MEKESSVLQLFPAAVQVYFAKLHTYIERLQEIRIRVDCPVLLYLGAGSNALGERYLSAAGELTFDKEQGICLNKVQIEDIVNHVCAYSPYAYAESLRQGFVTVSGGHRVGVAGQIVLEGMRIKTLKHICFLNIRISHQILGAADAVLPHLYQKGRIGSALLLSGPGCGKTTLLRDLIRQISDGNPYGAGVSVGVVDERSEIAGCYLGVPQNAVGARTDVLDACPKINGMMMLIRSMAPVVVAVDELGSMEDAAALRQVLHCGSEVLVSVHGTSFAEVRKKAFLRRLLEEGAFQRVVVLSGREQLFRIAEILDGEGKSLRV